MNEIDLIKFGELIAMVKKISKDNDEDKKHLEQYRFQITEFSNLMTELTDETVNTKKELVEIKDALKNQAKEIAAIKKTDEKRITIVGTVGSVLIFFGGLIAVAWDYAKQFILYYIFHITPNYK